MRKIFLTLLFIFMATAAKAATVCNGSDCLDYEKTLIAIRNTPGIEEGEKPGFFVFVDRTGSTIHLFSKPDTGLYPTYIKRKVKNNGKSVHIETLGYTGVSRQVFDPWFKQYQQLDDNLKKQVQSQK